MTGRLREAALWTGAALGLLSVVAGTAVMFFGYSFLIFRSGSMGPEIPTGSIALAKTVPAAELEPGDIVSVVSVTGARITHRLVDSTVRGDEASLILQGDTNTSPDEEIYQVIEAERAIASVPYLGYVITVLLSPAGLIGAGCLSGMVLLMTFGTQPGQPVSSTEGGKHRGPGRRVPTRGRSTAAVAVTGVVVAGLGVTSTSAFFSDRATVTSGDLTSTSLAVPATPTVGGGSAGAATVTWSATDVGTGATARRATSYDVLRYTAASGGTAAVLCGGTVNLSCTDTAPGTGTVYYSILARFGQWTREGARTAYAIPVAAQPPRNVACGPTGLLGLGGNYITWDAPASGAPISYRITYSADGAAPVTVNNVPLTPREFRPPVPSGNRTFTVTVAAVYAGGTSSAAVTGQIVYQQGFLGGWRC